MKVLVAGITGISLVFFGQSTTGPAASANGIESAGGRGIAEALVHLPPVPSEIGPEDLTTLVRTYCVRCHDDRRLTGNLSLEDFRVEDAQERPETAEKMIRKLRAGMMPPPGRRRPGGDSLLALVETLEANIDEAASAYPNPGNRTFQRLNRAEYQRSIADLLGLEIDAGDYLPLDTKSANFDNIADAQLLSATLLDSYLRAATEISRLAVGDPDVTASEAQYRVSRWASQIDRVTGAPYGTRGGTSVVHNFPADGKYIFRVSFHHETTGAILGNGRNALETAVAPEQLEVSVDGERVALLEVPRWMHTSDPDGVNLWSEPITVRAGPHRVTAAFIRRFDGPVQDLVSPHDWSAASTAIAGSYGIMALPHLRDLVVAGPYDATEVSDTPSRRKIFMCRPASPAEERPCAEEIISRLASEAFRRPVPPEDLGGLMALYERFADTEGFEYGVRTALEAILANPSFVFRLEEAPAGIAPDESYRIRDIDLASRLSFFLWGAPPDDELKALAAENELSDPDVLEAQVRRMLADPRSEALATRFASQWLRLQDLEKINPDVRVEPDFHQQLREAMRRETELFFHSLVQDDRSMLDLFTADYTFMNERLAKHYGVPGVAGENFRRVTYPSDIRRGVLGHASILTLTSHAGRTSPVLRGKWVMEVLMGAPPPPPPPGIPDLSEIGETEDGVALTTRQRMERHRADPVCNACHQLMDPIGLALDNFGVTGKVRIRENGAPLDTRGTLYDGTPLTSPSDLRKALLSRPIPLVRNFTENLMAYALGRRVEYYDQPTVRAITRQAEAEDYRMSSLILGVVRSDAFQFRKNAPVVETSGPR